jgi:hypothetical protein
MFVRWLLVCAAIVCLAMADEDMYALDSAKGLPEGPAGRGECVGDLDGDGDTDWSDLCCLLDEWGCYIDCKDGDVDGDGDVDLADLAALIFDLGCGEPDVVCEEPGEGLISVAMIPIDNSSVGLGDDPLAPAFDGGVTHFTFDLQVNIEDPWGDWCAALIDSSLTAPDVEFFLHPMDLGGGSPNPQMFTVYPALEFDSYWCGASVISPGESGALAGIVELLRTSTEMSAFWFDVEDTGDGIFTIMRFTIVMPPDAPAPPAVVPAGTGGTSPVIGTITGLVGDADQDPPCAEIAFDIIINCGEDCDGDGIGDECDNCPLDCNPSQEDCDGDGIGNVCDCPGDLDCDNDVNINDLADLLSNYGLTAGATYAQGDLDDDGDVELDDLGALLGVYGTGCD